MSLLEELNKQGVNVDEGLERVMGDESLYEAMLGMFIDEAGSHPICPEDFDKGDLETLIDRVHLLKGFTGNLAMEPLFTGYTQVLTLLRSGRIKEARAEFGRIPAVQEAIIECIKRYTGA